MHKNILLTAVLVALIVSGVAAAWFLRKDKREPAPGDDFEILE
ncbi:MAG TPA: hypothetical protein VG694_02535 [Candidatus Paceibacterota bacterium]|jgi:hypothetical protein|nr:hypothetical protein [Candidatus Paceibacterota bacterium]